MDTWQVAVSFGIGGVISLALVFWITRWLVPAMMQRFDNALEMFRQELEAQRAEQREEADRSRVAYAERLASERASWASQFEMERQAHLAGIRVIADEIAALRNARKLT